VIKYGVVLFHTTSSVLKAEKTLLRAGFKITLIPTPREFSSDCGIALRFDWDKIDLVKLRLDEEKVEFNAVYPLS
jgi:hypothetical protein